MKRFLLFAGWDYYWKDKELATGSLYLWWHVYDQRKKAVVERKNSRQDDG